MEEKMNHYKLTLGENDVRVAAPSPEEAIEQLQEIVGPMFAVLNLTGQLDAPELIEEDCEYVRLDKTVIPMKQFHHVAADIAFKAAMDLEEAMESIYEVVQRDAMDRDLLRAGVLSAIVEQLSAQDLLNSDIKPAAAELVAYTFDAAMHVCEQRREIHSKLVALGECECCD